MRSAILIPLLALPAAAGCQTTSEIDRAAHMITASGILTKVGVLAHDSMQGRLTPSPELDETAAWIGEHFARLGLTPAGEDSSFVQSYTIRQVTVDQRESGISVADGPTWRFGDVLATVLGTTAARRVAGPAVVVWGSPPGTAPLAELDLGGKIVMWFVPATAGGDPDIAFVNRAIPTVLARRPSAIVLVTERSNSAWADVQRLNERPRTAVGWEDTDRPPVLEARSSAVTPFLISRGLRRSDGDASRLNAQDLPETRLRVTVTDRVIEQLTAPNTVGILRGSDPVLRGEYIVYSAHMDHLGTSTNGGLCRRTLTDRICNGADDDASGTATIMEVAEAFATLETRPRRSIVFLAVSGEEEGLWGSDFFTARPPMPIEQIVANLNVDMVGRNAPDSIVVIGKDHSDLGRTLNDVYRDHPELGLIAADDIWPEENFYERSDHYNFARRGVPVLFFFNGTHPQYHEPSDEVDLIDGDKAARIGRLLFYLGLELANRDVRPAWDPESYRRIVRESR